MPKKASKKIENEEIGKKPRAIRKKAVAKTRKELEKEKLGNIPTIVNVIKRNRNLTPGERACSEAVVDNIFLAIINAPTPIAAFHRIVQKCCKERVGGYNDVPSIRISRASKNLLWIGACSKLERIIKTAIDITLKEGSKTVEVESLKQAEDMMSGL